MAVVVAALMQMEELQTLVDLAVVEAAMVWLVALETLRQLVRHKAITAELDPPMLGMAGEAVGLVRLVLQLAALHQAVALLALVALDRQITTGLVQMSPMQVVAAVVLGELLQHQVDQAALVVVAVEAKKMMLEVMLMQIQAVVVEAVVLETHLLDLVMVVQELWWLDTRLKTSGVRFKGQNFLHGFSKHLVFYRSAI